MARRGKSPDAFRTISEVAEILEIPAHVLRFWESRFAQIKPVKRGGGRRYYRPADIDLLRGIRDLLYSDGLTIRGVQKVLREKGVRHVAELGHLDPGEDPVVVGGDAEVAAAEAKPEVVAEPETTPEPAAEPEPAPVAARPARPAPEPHAAPRIDIPAGRRQQPTQIDLFAERTDRPRRAFPPDPAVAARSSELRRLLGELTGLRARMARGLE